VIFLTARAAEPERVFGFELGADDYLAKPFSPRELVARVRAVLRRAKPTPAAATAAASAPSPAGGTGAFEHDSEGHRIRFRGRPLALTRYEYGLLAALLQRPGAILTRAQLLDRVWGHDSDTGDRSVDTHIKTLRAKLREIAPDADPIRTERGIGYSLQSG
jgi:two-component system catabolic regulation response regulator CreB